jgi:hypothetical protein
MAPYLILESPSLHTPFLTAHPYPKEKCSSMAERIYPRENRTHSINTLERREFMPL